MPRIHPRERLVKEAEMKIKTAIVEAVKDLTQAESISVVAHVLGDEICGVMKYEIRHERHGNHDTPGGWASDDDDQVSPSGGETPARD